MLISKNIFLRKLQPSDADAMFEWENNPENWKVSGTTKPFTKKEINAFVNTDCDINRHQQIRYVICSNLTQQAIGTIDLFEFDVNEKRVGIGVLIAEVGNRKKGYAKEALMLMIDYCRNELEIVTIFCNILKDNAASIRLFEKCGFCFIEEQVLYENEVNYYELNCSSLSGVERAE